MEIELIEVVEEIIEVELRKRKYEDDVVIVEGDDDDGELVVKK